MPQVLDIQNHMPSQATQAFFKIYTDYKNLQVKHTTHKKAVSIRAASLSKLDNMVNNNSIFNTKCDEFSTK